MWSMFRPGDMVAFSSASNACVLSQQPQGAVCMMSQLECVSLQLLQWSPFIPSWWRVDTNTILGKNDVFWAQYCHVLCIAIEDQANYIYPITVLYLFLGVAFMPLLRNAKETCPDNFLTIPGTWSLQYHWSRQVARMKAEFRFKNDRRTRELHSLTPTAHICGVWVAWFPDPCSHATVCPECVSIFIKCLVWILLTLVGQNHSPESLQKDLLKRHSRQLPRRDVTGMTLRECERN